MNETPPSRRCDDRAALERLADAIDEAVVAEFGATHIVVGRVGEIVLYSGPYDNIADAFAACESERRAGLIDLSVARLDPPL